MSPWQVVAASVTGSAHLADGTPCQDAHAYETSGQRLVAVVCDGAGSAIQSDEGAQHMAEGVVAALLKLPSDAQANWQANVEAVIAEVRQALVQKAQQAERDLSDYACTLVGAFWQADAGFFFHVGDGVGVAEFAEYPPAISYPENGEYANETIFVTSPEWTQHLRIQFWPARPQRVVLMSDGAQSFAMNKGQSALFMPFIDPVHKYLQSVNAESGAKALAATLADPRTHQITGDDKTLLLAWSQGG